MIFIFIGLNFQACNDCEVDCQNGGDCMEDKCFCPDGFYGEFCETETIQHRLDLGERPIELFNNGVPLDSLYGKLFEGGLLFYLNTNDGSGLVAATEDQLRENISSCCATWGALQFDTGAIGAEIGDGVINSQKVISVYNAESIPTKDIAIQLCMDLELNGFSDWFLPSRGELNLMWENLADYDGDGLNSGRGDPGNLGGFVDNVYWSSTEHNESFARMLRFNEGTSTFPMKSAFGNIRAARAF